jgi:hypothetical protein
VAILPAMQSAAVRLLGQKPGSFFGSSNTFEMEIADLVNEVAIDIANYQDWQGLTKFATIVSNGTTTAFDLPDDYDHMVKTAKMNEVTSWFWGYSRVLDISDFATLRASGFGPVPGAWALYGNQIQFAPAPTQNATYPYISNAYAIDAGTQARKPAFDKDTDTFVLPERLLTLGLIYKWRENKGLATSDGDAYYEALNNAGADDKGARVYRSNSRRSLPGVGIAWPWQLG